MFDFGWKAGDDGYYLDKDGYPTEEFLKHLEDGDNFNEVHEIIELIEGAWWMPDWGLRRKKPFTHRVFGTRLFTYYMSTGGWSGNESIMYSLQKNFMFWFHWHNTRVGGHYTFRFPVKK